MSDNGGCGVGLAMLAIMAVLIAVVAIGAPVITGDGLAWDNSTAIARTNARLEAERVRAAAETRQAIEREETARIMSDNMMATIQWLAVAGALVAVVFIAGWAVQRSVSAWAARPHRPMAPVPSQIIVMLATPELEAAPEAYLGYNDDDDTWAVVNPRTGVVKLLEDRSAPPRLERRRA